jgi:acetyltransferase-like isoleucine patch superfamily enzyme
MAMRRILKSSLALLCNSIYEILQRGRVWHFTRDMKLGEHVFIRPPLNVFYPKNVTVEDNVYINSGLTILAQDKVFIGSYTMIATNVSIITVDHDYSKIRQEAVKAHKKAPVHIEKNVWLGANTVVLAGVTIGEGAVLGAGSVVTHNIPPYTIACGVPARPVKKRIIN